MTVNIAFELGRALMKRFSPSRPPARGLGVLCFLAVVPVWGQAQILSCKAASPPQTQALIEVFTSEGCSSCPPADRWLSALVQVPSQKLMTVALSLHVDYWDYIGWKDPFAKAAFTHRADEHRRIGAE